MFDRVDAIDLKNKLTSYRRDFHKHPEAGWTEYRTTVKIIEALDDLGIDIIYGPEIHTEEYMMGKPSPEVDKENIERAINDTNRADLISKMEGGYTGAVGIIQGDNPGPTLAMRFDIDCNDIEESQDSDHLPYREGFASIHRGLMHACGHDGHASIGLGVAEILSKYKDKINGKVILIFQAAEEGGRGALSHAKSGILEDVDYILAGHIGLRADKTGLIAASAKGFMASNKFDVKFTGKSAHAGANPELGHNALAAASTAVLNLLAIPRHSKGLSRVNIGTLEAGPARNAIPDTALMKIETRGLMEEINDFVHEKALKVIQHAAMMYDCSYDIEYMGGTASVDCDEDFIDIVMDSIQYIEGIKEIKRAIEFGAGEDFTYMMKEVQQNGGKSTFIMLGSDLPDAHHSKKFDFDEEVLMTGANIFAKLALDIGK